jgi:hypothetical protein
MHRYIYPSIAALAVLFAGQGAVAEQASTMLLVPNEAAVAWQTGPADLPKGSQIAVLAGDPANLDRSCCA